MQNGLNEIINQLEKEGIVLRVKEFVDPEFEITEITDRACRKFNGKKAILFENTGTGIPVLTYLPGFLEEIYEHLGLHDLHGSKDRMRSFYQSSNSTRKSFLVEFLNNRSFYRLARFEPLLFSGMRECQQVIHLDPDINILPILSNWQKDGGRCILGTLAHTKSPNSGITSVDYSVLQFFSKNIAGVDFQNDSVALRNFADYKRIGQQMPVAITLGNDPSYSFPLCLPSSINKPHYFLAGIIKGRAVNLVKGITVEVDFPSDAEIVIEGYIDPQEELIWHGPYGTSWGHYSTPKWVHKLFVTCITHRSNAVYNSAINSVPEFTRKQGTPLLEQLIIDDIRHSLTPEIIDIFFPFQQIMWGIAIVKIRKKYEGQPNKIANQLWGLDAFKSIKILVLVDGEIETRNLVQVSRLISEIYNPLFDTYKGSGPCDINSNSSDREGVEGKLLIDATAKVSEERKSKSNFEFDLEGVAETLSDKELMVESYSSRMMAIGISLLIVGYDYESTLSVKTTAARILRKVKGSKPKVIVFIDKRIKIEDTSMIAWNVLSSIDPARDCFFIDLDDEKISSLIIDATTKIKDSEKGNLINPTIVSSSRETIEKVDKKWIDLEIGEMINSPSLLFYKE